MIQCIAKSRPLLQPIGKMSNTQNVTLRFLDESRENLDKKLYYPRKDLINIQNINDNDCFKRWFVRYLHPTDDTPRRIKKIDKLYGSKLDFKDTKLPVKVRDIRKIKRKNSIGLVFLVMKIGKSIQSMCQKMLGR